MDGTTTQAVSNVSRVLHASQPVSDGSNAIDIYTTLSQTGNTTGTKNKTVPFVNNVTIKNDNGELVRIRALFNDGAMVNAMCTTVFETVKHRLRGWTHSSQTLRMANGSVIPATAQWTGTVRIGTVEVQTTFIVFNSGGGWAFLVGKPMLQMLRAVHDYSKDQLTITDGNNATTLTNRYYDMVHEQVMGSKNRTLDIKQRPQEQRQTTETYTVTQTTEDVFTRQMDPFNPRRVEHIVNAVTIGQDLTEAEKQRVKAFIAEYADVFACLIKEVLPVLGAMINLNVPTNTSFTTTV